jgi:class 3 adenylate cyclase
MPLLSTLYEPLPKQLISTVLFADLKGSMELLADRDPEEARQLLDPVLERMMAAVHRYEGHGQPGHG